MKLFSILMLLILLGSIVPAMASTSDGIRPEGTNHSGDRDPVADTGRTAGLSGQAMTLDVLELKNMDIADALKLISQKSGMNIITGPDVKGQVTVFLRNVGVHEALRIIVEANGWAYANEGNILRVMTDKKYEEKYGHRFGQRIETELFILSYAKADLISAKVREMLTPVTGTLRFDERSNRIIISDTPAKIAEVRALIGAFDQKEKEVLIEAKILQVVLTDEHKLGVDWEAVVSDLHGLNFKSGFDVLGDTERKGKVGVGTIAADGYAALIEALETLGHTEILSSPRITSSRQ